MGSYLSKPIMFLEEKEMFLQNLVAVSELKQHSKFITSWMDISKKVG